MTEISTYTTSAPAAAAADVSAAAAARASSTGAAGPTSGTVATVSTLAQQISDAATRAAARDAKLNRSELAEAAKAIIEKIVGQTYQWNQARHDAEVPKTDDPALLARARQATDSIYGKAANPFAGMPRDQLTLIAYDEGGSFTVNERRAAWNAAFQQESEWRKQVVARSMEAYHRTGNANAEGVGQEMLDHYRSLPAIEQAQYPRAYESQLQAMIATSGQDQRSSFKMEPLTLLSLLNKWAKAREEDGFPTDATRSAGVLPKPDLAKFEAQAALPRHELYAMYERVVADLAPKTDVERAAANAEVPKSDDPDRLAQAVKATAYLFAKGASPFASLTRNEVAAIYYDDSGVYTRNERMAAVKQLNEIDTRLWNGPTTRASNTGDWREVMEMGLKAYDDALPIEKMRYPANYKMLLQGELDADNAKAGGALSKERRQTLLEMMDALSRYQPQTALDAGASEDVARPWNDAWSAKLVNLLRHLADNRGAGGAGDARSAAGVDGSAAQTMPAAPPAAAAGARASSQQ